MKPGGSLFGRLANLLLNPVGLELRRKRGSCYMHYLGFRTVLDVGANTGQFATEARSLLPTAEIHCFEPLPGPCRALHRLRERDGRLFVHQTAVGDFEGEVEMFESEFIPSSSILPMAEAHGRLFDSTENVRPIQVPITTLDTWAEGRDLPGPLLMKLDVQGYEDRALRGASRMAERTDVLVVEVSFLELYRGQLLFDEIYPLLRGLGFRSVGLQGTAVDRSSGAILQADAVFMRECLTWSNQ